MKWGHRVAMEGSLEVGPQGSPSVSSHRLGPVLQQGQGPGSVLGIRDEPRPQPLSPYVPPEQSLT